MSLSAGACSGPLPLSKPGDRFLNLTRHLSRTPRLQSRCDHYLFFIFKIQPDVGQMTELPK